MEAPDQSGHLQEVISSTQKKTYFCELCGEVLYLYLKKPTADEHPVASIDCSAIPCANDENQRFGMILSGSCGKERRFLAPTQHDKEVWKERLENPNRENSLRREVKEPPPDTSEQMVFNNGPVTPKMSISDFEVLNVIGKGSFGNVLRVRKKSSGEIFAMKEMRKEIIERDNLLENTLAEKSILQKIRHPYIVNLHYAFQSKDRICLVLDFLSGGELFFHLSEVGRFDVSRARFYVAQIGLVIGHLHSLDIIYRDLKPENAVLDADGNVCLTDFGLAKTNARFADAETFCGTPEYLAPEFLIGGGHGKAVDWWSLGVLLYEMVFGIPPFYSENVNEMYELILSKPLEFTEETTPELEDLLRLLLDRNPDTRLCTFEAFRDHPFFADLNWDDLYHKRIPPPFKPDPEILNNFPAEFTELPAEFSESGGKAHQTLIGFTYEGEK